MLQDRVLYKKKMLSCVVNGRHVRNILDELTEQKLAIEKWCRNAKNLEQTIETSELTLKLRSN